MNERGRWEDRPTLEDCWGRSVWALGTAAAHADADWVRQVAVGPVRASGATALAVAAGDGLRRHRCRRAARGEARASRGAGAARGRRRHAAGPRRRTTGVAVAGADVGVRQRRHPRGDDRRRLAPRPTAAAAAGPGPSRLVARPRDDRRAPLGHAGGRQRARSTSARPSTSSRSRSRPSPMPAPGPPASTAPTRCGLDGVARSVAWFLGDNDGSHVMWDPATGGGFDGLEADGAEPQPGHRVDARAARHAATRPPPGPGMSPTAAARRSPRDPATRRRTVPGSSPGCSFRARRASTTRTRAPRRWWRASLALDDHEIGSTLDQVMTGFGGRHRDLLGTFERHAAAVADRLEPGCELSDDRRLLLGATFTSEYAIEGAALCNPSMVAHPDQSGVPAGQPPVRDERPRRRRGPSILHRVPDGHDRRHRATRPSILRRDSRVAGTSRAGRAGRRHLPERAPPARQPRGERRLRPRRAR